MRRKITRRLPVALRLLARRREFRRRVVRLGMIAATVSLASFDAAVAAVIVPAHETGVLHIDKHALHWIEAIATQCWRFSGICAAFLLLYELRHKRA